MSLVVYHADHVIGLEVDKHFLVKDILLESTGVDCSEAVKGVNAQLVWPKAHHRAVLLVQGMNGADLGVVSTLFDPFG